jgi:hypothetical protein
MFRQTIILSSFASAEINALYNRHCLNWEGKVKLRQEHQVSFCPPEFTFRVYKAPLLSGCPSGATFFAFFSPLGMHHCSFCQRAACCRG